MKQVVFILLLAFSYAITYGQTANLVEGHDTTKMNVSLARELDTIYHDDQDSRIVSDSIEKKYGLRSKEMNNLWETIRVKDSIDQVKVISIIDKYGWLGTNVIGSHGNSTLFLVIQHADFSIQQKYLPLMREAVKKGNARGSELALLEDRVALRSGKKQIYGSQISEYLDSSLCVLPLEDPDNVDKRRAEVGLNPMSVYLSHFHMTWDVEQYKKDLPAIEAREKALYDITLRK